MKPLVARQKIVSKLCTKPIKIGSLNLEKKAIT
jgi:hypothetical protein